MISFIVAMDNNRLIGKNNDLPWHLPADLKYFKRITMGHPIVMGRKTFESIGRILPGRENIVITRNKDFSYEGCTIFHSIDAFLDRIQSDESEEYFVIGGSEIFHALFPKADRLYITKINDEFEGDTYFPPFSLDEWELVSQEKGPKDEKNPFDYEFLVFDRKPQ